MARSDHLWLPLRRRPQSQPRIAPALGSGPGPSGRPGWREERTGSTVHPSLVVLTTAFAPSAVATEQHGASERRLPARVVAQRVKMIDFAFRPKSITLSMGTNIKWVNGGNAPHSTTSNTGLWDSGVLDPAGTFGRVFRKAGTFKYHCTVHPTLMRGVITVK